MEGDSASVMSVGYFRLFDSAFMVAKFNLVHQKSLVLIHAADVTGSLWIFGEFNFVSEVSGERVRAVLLFISVPQYKPYNW